MQTSSKILSLLCIAELLALSLWFSGTAVLPQLAAQWHAGTNVTSWLTLAVQLGFVCGALLSATFNLADILKAPRLVAVCMVLGAACNVGFALSARDSISAALIFRFLTGAALAGVYPPGMKILAGWFRERRGFALGAMIGSLAIGSALPHGVNALGAISQDNWQYVVLASSALALAGAAIVFFSIHDGPFAAPSPPFDLRQVGMVLRNRRLRLANFGYLGHMWELYSMWGWLAVMLAASASDTAPMSPAAIRAATFLLISSGFFGCLWAGYVSDRASGEGEYQRIWQRAKVTIIAMSVSGACCLLTALFFHNVIAVMVICVFWGLSISADSAQFSAIISEVSDPLYIGTALTLQTAMGFLLTVFSIRVMAFVAANWGWPAASAMLAIGPALGIIAMLGLRPERQLPAVSSH